ncbi:MAG: response regulator transcription factor [Bacteroidales bacterium]|nr:response regulator transcription factor [Bacteroidales bacterium]
MKKQIEDQHPISILIAEDDMNLGFVLKDFLSLQGFDAVLCRDGIEAIETFRKKFFNLCVLDVMMPKLDGFAVAKEIRDINPDVPIIFLTAKSLQEDLIKGFKIGCDDYITKPFSTDELNLRIKAVMKRCSNLAAPSLLGYQVVMIGSVEFDMGNLTLKVKDEKKILTRKEGELLKLLYDNKNKIVKREIATGEIWKNSTYFSGRSMDVFITRLRKYLSSDPAISIINVHGSGFKLIIEEED